MTWELQKLNILYQFPNVFCNNVFCFFLDQFVVHFESVIPDKYVEKLDSGKGWQKKQLKVRR